MFKEFFIILLLGHILGDFYIQTSEMSQKKENSLKWVWIHGLCYGGTMLVICLPMISYEMILGATAASLLHFAIDTIKFSYFSVLKHKNKKTQVSDRNVFFIDQLLHILFLIIIAYTFVAQNVEIREWKVIKDFFNTVTISETFFVAWILALLMIHKPANIAIQKLLMIYKPETENVDLKRDKNAGRFIGTVERIIMLIFLSIQQYSAIGLVLTAKSIARYDRISKERDFAEYYLLGTLISTVVVIIVSFIL